MKHGKPKATQHYRSVFISDVHLGYRGCAAGYLLEFLRTVHCERLYLVGDIVDLWEMRDRGLYWPEAHNEVLKAFLAKAAGDTEVIYIPGNHDELMRDYVGLDVLGVAIRRQAIHETAAGKRLLVTHGDEFDVAVKASRWLKRIGTGMYDALLRVNYWLNAVRHRLGFGYWSLAGAVKRKVKNAVDYIDSFERAVAAEARRRGVDGLICGHIHHAQISQRDGVMYCNSGDWVESCTALVERPDGSLAILNYLEAVHQDVVSPAAAAEAA